MAAYWQMLHPYTSMAVASVTMLLARLPGESLFGSPRLGHIGLTMLLVQFSIGLSNDLLDQNYDAVAKPEKPLVDGRADRRWATLLLAMIVLWAWWLGLGLGRGAFGLLLLGQTCGIVYNLGLKRTFYAWIPHAIAAPTILVWVRLINHTASETLFWIYPLGLILGPALNIANQLAGAEESGASGERSLVHILGVKNAGRAAAILFATSGLLTIMVIVMAGGDWRAGKAAFGVALLALAIFIVMAQRDQRLLLWPSGLAIGASLGLGFHLALPA